MSSVKYEQQILDAIETIAKKTVDSANYDKTIKAQIIERTNAAIGEYKVRYQDSVFYAYSNNIDIKYASGTLVYILIPGNDMRQEKSIIGAVEKNEIEYADVFETEDYYSMVGGNACNDDTEYNLCSYAGESSIILFDKNNDINLVNFDEQNFTNYLQNNDNFICGAYFKTNLDAQQRNKGNYGIIFELRFKNEMKMNILLKNML